MQIALREEQSHPSLPLLPRSKQSTLEVQSPFAAGVTHKTSAIHRGRDRLRSGRTILTPELASPPRAQRHRGIVGVSLCNHTAVSTPHRSVK